MTSDGDAVDRVVHGGVSDPDLLDFSANVNPRTPEGTREVYRRTFEACSRYPDDSYRGYREAAAASVDCQPGDVVPTAGGLAGIRLALSTSVSPGVSVAVPYPSFGEYHREVKLQGGEPVMMPYRDVVDVTPEDHDAVLVCDPNNPTGDVYRREDVVDLCRRCSDADTVAVVDEAFLPYTDRRSVAGVEGAVVVRSLTKIYGLPGLRMGFLVASGGMRERLEGRRRTWNLGAPAAAVGEHVLGCQGFVEETRERVERERGRLRDALSERFEVRGSDAPYLLLEVEDDVDVLLERLRERGVVVRDARSFRGLDSHVRVAVRLPEENDVLLSAVEQAADQ